MADVTIGAKLTLDAGQSTKTMKEFKAEVKSAEAELLNMQHTFGATSKEALNAAKKVAQLKDNLQDANETAKLFDPSNKFQVLGNAVRGLVGGFTALQGALALAGVEGEDLQKTLLKVQGALALTEGLNVVADVTKDFQRLGSVLVQTLGKSGLIGVAIAGVAALGLAISGVFSRKQAADVEAYNDTLKDYTRAAADARTKTVEVKVAFEQYHQGVISQDQALKVYNDTLGESLGKTNSLADAERLLAEKAEAYIKITGLKAQANALFAKAAESSSSALILQDKLTRESISGGGILGAALDKAESRIEKTIKDAKDIEALGASLLRQAGQLSQGFNINTGAPTSTKTTKLDRNSKPPEEVERSMFITKWLAEIELAAFLEKNRLRALDAESAKSFDDRRFLNSTTLQQLQTEMEANEAAARIQIAEQEAEAKIAAAKSIGDALGALSELVGKQTAAGKALAIAQATINTWVGVTEVLRAESVLPEPFATIAKIANVAAIIASGLTAIKNIAKTPVPGGGAGGGGALSSSAPLQPAAPAQTNTLLNQQQLNQIGNASVRAFVVESDVTNNQERIRRLNRQARI